MLQYLFLFIEGSLHCRETSIFAPIAQANPPYQQIQRSRDITLVQVFGEGTLRLRLQVDINEDPIVEQVCIRLYPNFLAFKIFLSSRLFSNEV